jgi:hypothetical protein
MRYFAWSARGNVANFGGARETFQTPFGNRRRFHVTLRDDVVLVRDEEPVSAVVAGEIVLLSVRAGAYFGLNKIGGEIWEILKGPASVKQIYQSLSQQYDVETAVLKLDVDPFLQALVDSKLVRLERTNGNR